MRELSSQSGVRLGRQGKISDERSEISGERDERSEMSGERDEIAIHISSDRSQLRYSTSPT